MSVDGSFMLKWALPGGDPLYSLREPSL